MKRNYFGAYFLIILPLLACIAVVLSAGRHLSPSAFIFTSAKQGTNGFQSNSMHPLTILLMQILVVLACAKLFGHCFKLIGQQAVIGEMITGIFLGPSILGLFSPTAFQLLFPESSLSNLNLLSQVGLLLFMFIIGMELDTGVLKNRAGPAIIISHVSIVFPYLLGVILAYFLYVEYAPSKVSFLIYALFIGIAMSITAFPVLARILKERNMTKTPVGSMAIICAAINDITGWCILAVVVALARAGNIITAIYTILLACSYVLGMLVVVRPLLSRVSGRFFATGSYPRSTFITLVFLVFLASSFVADLIGIHALFGAFLAGVIMPADVSLRKFFASRVEDVSIILLLPLFFAFTGLHTQLGLLNNINAWLLCALVISLAVTGKLIGSAATARYVGYNWKDSLSIGALMNTRGLMELIVLNIGYELGILTPEIFTVMVLTALFTTFMTTPILNLIERFFPEPKKTNIAVNQLTHSEN